MTSTYIGPPEFRRHSNHLVLSGHLCKTVEAEAEGDSPFGTPYQYPPPFPKEMKLKERIALDKGYEPPRHPNTGVDEEEALYESHLLPVPEALEKLKDIPVQQHVVKVGWEGITRRLAMGT